jgi:hypothetical protein
MGVAGEHKVDSRFGGGLKPLGAMIHENIIFRRINGE